MISGPFEITFCSLPDRENMVAQIMFAHQQVAEISCGKPPHYVVEIYPMLNGKPWHFGFDDFCRALQAAQERLTGWYA